MRKKILFVIPDLGGNGASKSLINLLSILDKERFEIDLLVFNCKGLFADMVPEGVNMVEVPSPLKEYWYQIHFALGELMKRKMFYLVYCRLKWKLMEIFKYKPAIVSQKNYLNIESYIPFLEGHYYAAIGYLDFAPTYFIVDKVKADLKIGWNHNDYSKLAPDFSIERKYLEKLDYLITVSEGCKSELERSYNDLSEKIKVIENINSPLIISRMAENEHVFEDNYNGLRIVTIGRLVEQKGIDLAIFTCKKLIESGYNIRWYIIGEGSDRPKLEGMIEKHRLHKNFFLVGEVRNPYPFIDGCDIYVQPSRYEGKSIAVEEVKIFNKPMVLTDHPGFYEQITNEINGLIVSMDVNGIYTGIKRMIDDSILRSKFTSNLKSQKHGNEEEVGYFYRLLDGKFYEK
ncbi:glycosyltransferase [Neobacillus niacini]|uniref:glycosyltransferase n=1 Tax=Neobacillus niacini TaxID=86668 RepID=UPI002FFDBFAD